MKMNEKDTADHAGNQDWIKVVCPHCGYEMPIFCGKNAVAEDLQDRKSTRLNSSHMA